MPSPIVNTIFAQFGGSRAMSMIGGKAISMDETTLRIKWAAPAKNGARIVAIKLMPSDTYTVTFMTLGGKTIRVLEDIYAEQLRFAFEYNTGLYLSL